MSNTEITAETPAGNRAGPHGESAYVLVIGSASVDVSVMTANLPQPGETVVVVGVGGIGASAVQGARLAGAETIVAIDPVSFKREQAVRFGAHATFTSMEEAHDPIRTMTRGRMAHKVIMAMGVGRGDLMDQALGLTAKLGRVVVTNIHPYAENRVSMNLSNLTGMEKQVVGSLFGSANPRADIPKLL